MYLSLTIFIALILPNEYLVQGKVMSKALSHHDIKKRAKVDRPVVVGYLPSWANGRVSPYGYDVANVSANHITHLVYAFINVNTDGSLVHPAGSDAQYKAMQNLKKINPKLLIIPSVGGASYRWFISEMAKSDDSLQNFASNVESFITKYGFDGIDIDWEYPYATEESRYSKMLELLRNKLGEDKTIMSAVPAGKDNFAGFDPVAMNKYLDLVGVMAYDFHGSWETATGHNAPLKASNDFSTEGTMELWSNYGISKDKLVVGLPFYGRTWKLANPSNNGVNAPSFQAGDAGPLGLAGFFGYNEYSDMKGWTEEWDSVAQVPYAFKGDQWLSFDNAKSLDLKIDYACSKFAGVMIWDLAFDSKNALLPEVYSHTMEKCGGNNGDGGVTTTSSTTRAPQTTTRAPQTTTTKVPPIKTSQGPPATTSHGTQASTSSGNGGATCTTDPAIICQGKTGLVPYPPNCGKYVSCPDKNIMTCPPNLQFHSSGYCDYPENVGCKPCTPGV